MARGEFTRCEDALRQHAYSVEPSELPLSLREDVYWRGLRWLEVAKLLHVQLTLLLDDGWQVPSRVRLGLVDRAMRLHEAGAAVANTGEALCEALLDDRTRRKLDGTTRAPCARCGAVGETSRKPASTRGSDKACYCENCMLGGETALALEQEEAKTRAEDVDETECVEAEVLLYCGEPVGQACLVAGGCELHRRFWERQYERSGRSFQAKHDPGLQLDAAPSEESTAETGAEDASETAESLASLQTT